MNDTQLTTPPVAAEIIETTPVARLAAPETSLAAPAMSIEAAIARRQAVDDMITKLMKEGHDYAVIPGTKKPSLLKPGAELAIRYWGCSARCDVFERTTDRETGFCEARAQCEIIALATGEIVAAFEGSCNTFEDKYRYRWLTKAKLPFGVNPETLPKKGHKSQFGKGDYYTFRVDNTDLFTLWNTIDKMAQKRALVGAALVAFGLSDRFTQDIEDNPSAFVGGKANSNTPNKKPTKKKPAKPEPPEETAPAPDNSVDKTRETFPNVKKDLAFRVTVRLGLLKNQGENITQAWMEEHTLPSSRADWTDDDAKSFLSQTEIEEKTSPPPKSSFPPPTPTPPNSDDPPPPSLPPLEPDDPPPWDRPATPAKRTVVDHLTDVCRLMAGEQGTTDLEFMLDQLRKFDEDAATRDPAVKPHPAPGDWAGLPQPIAKLLLGWIAVQYPDEYKLIEAELAEAKKANLAPPSDDLWPRARQVFEANINTQLTQKQNRLCEQFAYHAQTKWPDKNPNHAALIMLWDAHRIGAWWSELTDQECAAVGEWKGDE